ncbi:MAG: hypothetical protein ABWJ97_03920 [Thermoproteus sp.]
MELGFTGRRRCFEEVRRYAFALRYGPGDVTLRDSAVRDGDGISIDCSGDIPLQLFSKLSEALPGAVLGIDLGAAKNGLVMVWRGRPVLHVVVPGDELKRILESVRGLSEVAMGSSPYVDPKYALEGLRPMCVSVRLVDERKAARSRYWLKAKYPQLVEDEIDALSFTLTPGIALDICRKPL